MKLSWIVISGPPTREAMARLEVIADTYLSVNAPIQLAAPVLLEQRKQVQPLLLDRVRVNIEELDRQLGKQKVCTRLDVEGGWYAVMRVPVTQTDEELAITLLKNQSVLVHPGHFYDFSADGHLVVSLITPASRFREGIGRVLESFV
jgi:aspartate/methionine/tyrosine aminotransferase